MKSRTRHILVLPPPLLWSFHRTGYNGARHGIAVACECWQYFTAMSVARQTATLVTLRHAQRQDQL